MASSLLATSRLQAELRLAVRASGLLSAVVAALLLSVPAAHAVPITFVGSLSGPNESPANASPGTGSAVVTIDGDAHTLQVDVTFSGLLAGDTASHIHCCTTVPETGTAIVATTTPTFTGFPGGVTSGTYSHLFDLTLASSFNGAFITAHGGTTASAEAALLAGMLAGESYLNVHSSMFPGGEIRAFLEPVPEPTTLLLLGTSLGFAALRGRRRRT